MGCGNSSSTAGNSPTARSAKDSDLILKNAQYNPSSETVLRHCREIQDKLLEMELAEKRMKGGTADDYSEEAQPNTEMDAKSQEWVKARLTCIVDAAKGCRSKKEFLRGACLNELLVAQNMLRKAYPRTAANFKYVIKIALELVEKNLEMDKDSVSDKIRNLTPFSSTNDLAAATSAAGAGEQDGKIDDRAEQRAPVVRRSSSSNSALATVHIVQHIVQAPPAATPSTTSDLISFKGRAKALADQSHHSSTSSMEEFGFFDISTHSVDRGRVQEARGVRGTRESEAVVQLQLAKAIDSGVELFARGRFSLDELGGKSHG